MSYITKHDLRAGCEGDLRDLVVIGFLVVVKTFCSWQQLLWLNSPIWNKSAELFTSPLIVAHFCCQFRGSSITANCETKESGLTVALANCQSNRMKNPFIVSCLIFPSSSECSTTSTLIKTGSCSFATFFLCDSFCNVRAYVLYTNLIHRNTTYKINNHIEAIKRVFFRLIVW